jgi:hypothetical protein
MLSTLWSRLCGAWGLSLTHTVWRLGYISVLARTRCLGIDILRLHQKPHTGMPSESRIQDLPLTTARDQGPHE